MQTPRRGCLAKFVVTAWIAGAWLSTVPPAAGNSATVTRIRHSVKDNHTRIVLDLSSKVAYELRSFENPSRLAINLPKTNASQDLKRFDIAEGVVRRVRINKLSWGTQIVLDLRFEVDWSDLYLAPVDEMPDRIVIDVGRSKKSKVPSSSPPSPVRVTSKKRQEKPKREFIVAIDAGHGGKDPGAIGRHELIEKKIALDLARRVAGEINAMGGFKAVLTRDSDVYLDLVRRVRIAKNKGADIFVSIHLNSAKRKSARGVEVFFISPAGAKATANKLLSSKSSAARELGLDAPQNDDIMHMLVDVNQQAMMQRSQLLAEEILKGMNRRGLPPTRGIKQRSFAVLKSIDMPSVMLEAGFITNSKDAGIFKKSKGRQDVAVAIAAGVVSFLKKYPPPDAQEGRLRIHTVRRGDTLWKISREYKTTVASIQKSNKLGRSHTIHVGQELVVREGYDRH
ncbi:MAG: N-acetylmuramoyl-L-alanine amidase [Candidatus Latescibacterota bacterium]|nr:MAG: N-acetylmuramoyl-L-alanine amidase [Candidatus Latescibacterota bacterium]